MSLAGALGLQALSSGAGAARVRAVCGPAHLNMHGTAHGGFLYALADEAFALASNSREGAAVALATSFRHFHVVREGDALIAEAREEHLGRRVGTWRVEVRRDAPDGGRDGEVVALFEGTAYRLEPQ